MSGVDNPSAFPEVPGDFNGYEGRAGMTLRDWFAGQALASIIDRAPVEAIQDILAGVRGGRPMAYGAYAIADAMLAERTKAAKP